MTSQRGPSTDDSLEVKKTTFTNEEMFAIAVNAAIIVIWNQAMLWTVGGTAISLCLSFKP